MTEQAKCNCELPYSDPNPGCPVHGDEPRSVQRRIAEQNGASFTVCNTSPADVAACMAEDDCQCAAYQHGYGDAMARVRQIIEDHFRGNGIEGHGYLSDLLTALDEGANDD